MANPKNLLEGSDKDKYDSPLTLHGTPRKRKYTKNRKSRAVDFYETKVKKTRKIIKQQNKELLASYAPIYSQIYTQSYSKSLEGRYLYIDFFVVNNNRIYKMTNLIGKLMGWKVVVSKRESRAPYLCAVPYKFRDLYSNLTFIEMEEMATKLVSREMFGTEDGYFWQSLLRMYPHDIKKPEVKKSFVVTDKTTEWEQGNIVEKKEEQKPEEPKKSYIVRKT